MNVSPVQSKFATNLLLIAFALVLIGVFIWQGISAGGAPDPTQPNTSKTSAVFDIGVLVFREGLECILVLTAITANNPVAA